MNIAVIFAGGSGQRMNTKTKPKQFLELHGKPILIYTMEAFENAPSIDAIVLVMLKEWIDYSQKLINQYGLSKVKAIVPGGSTGQESIFHGVKTAYDLFSGDNIVLIHDGVRPLIDIETIEACVECTREHGTAVTVTPATETVALIGKDEHVGDILPRENCQIVKAPQCFKLGDLYQAHINAQEEGLDSFIDTASLMQYYGHKLYTVEGPFENIKITTPGDYYIFRAISDAREDSQIFGI